MYIEFLVGPSALKAWFEFVVKVKKDGLEEKACLDISCCGKQPSIRSEIRSEAH